MSFRRSCAAVSLVALLGVSSVAWAQRAEAPSLDEILQRLEANLNHYDKSVPSFFCDEHVVSSLKPGVGERATVTDSIFRLKRVENPDHTSSFAESREIQKVNGEPSSAQPLRGFPSMVVGLFEGGLAVVSLGQKACMSYKLERRDRPNAPYIIDFSTALKRGNTEKCLLQEKTKGRVFIDPVSMEIKHLEMTAPHHVILPGNAYGWAVVGKWVVTIDYVPVVLDGDTFWLPSTIMSRDTSIEGGPHGSTWTFQANYANYHRLEVKSRILPGSETAVP